MAQAPTIDRLLNLVPDSPDSVLGQLESYRELAGKQDAHGYSLVHAAASYGHERLLTALIRQYNVDPNIRDEDGETALFSVEELHMAKELIELGTDISLTNQDGQTAAEKLADEDEQPPIAAYLREVAASVSSGGHAAQTETATANAPPTSSSSFAEQSALNGETNEVRPPPPLPNGMQLNVGVMAAAEAGDEPDPEFRRRIEELAARPDFQTEEGQRELRSLVTDAISGLANEGPAPPASRRRLN